MTHISFSPNHTKKVICAFGLFALSFSPLYAVPYSIKGQVLDKASNQPIDFANVSLYKINSTQPLSGVTTDTQGKFTIDNINTGKYRLVVSFLGYKEEKKEIEIKGNTQSINIGKIYLNEDTKILQEVEVVGQASSMRFELDKKIFTVDQDIASSGGSVTDALNNIPSLDVDQEGNISLRNSESVEIWINGKPSGLSSENQAQVLEQMPAASIKEIEIITNPSAKFSPEGTAGIINIVMKKDATTGYYGSVSGRIDYCLASPWNVPPGGNVSLNLNFSTKVVSGYFNAGYNYRTSNGTTTNDRYNFVQGDTTRTVKEGTTKRNGGGLFLRAGLDFQITERSTIGISGFGIIENGNDKTNGGFSHQSNAPTDYRLYNVNQYINHQNPNNIETLTKAYLRRENSFSYHPGWNTLLDWQFAITKKHHLTMSAEVFSFSFNNNNTYHQFDYFINNSIINGLSDEKYQTQQTKNTMKSAQFKADYEWKPNQGSRLEAGWQTDLGKRTTNANAWNDKDYLSQLLTYFNEFDNSEQTHAIYLTYGNTFWKHLSIQLGLRGEYFKRHIKSTFYDNEENLVHIASDTSYFQLFPSAYLNYSFKNNNELQFNYTRRIDRPRGHQINPRQNLSDSTNIQYGNPELIPQFSSSFELNYLKLWDNHTLSAGLFYRTAKNIIQNINYLDNNILRNTFINAGKRHEAGIELVAKNKIYREYLNVTTSINFYYNSLKKVTYVPILNGEEKDAVQIPQKNLFVWSMRLNLNFMITKSFTGQLTARYSSPRVVAQGTSSHNYFVDLNLRKTFLDKKLALSFSIRDIFNSRSRKNTTSSATFWQYATNQWNSRLISLTLTYNFGTNDNNKRKDNKDIRQDESSIQIFEEGGEGEM